MAQGSLPKKKRNAQAGHRGHEPDIENIKHRVFDRIQRGGFHKNLRERIKRYYGKQQKEYRHCHDVVFAGMQVAVHNRVFFPLASPLPLQTWYICSIKSKKEQQERSNK